MKPMYFNYYLHEIFFLDKITSKKKKSTGEIKLFEDNSDDGKSGFNTIIQLETGGRNNL